MSRAWWLPAALALAAAAQAEDNCKPAQPCYFEGGVVNAASFTAGHLAPNTLATIFGARLSYSTRAISIEDIDAGSLPTLLPGTGVRVLVGNVSAHMYYVSPVQVNFLIPSNLTAAEVTVQLARDGAAGPPVRLSLKEVAPALFLMDPETVVATRADFSVITADNPARPGEYVILWATGLGRTVPPAVYGQLPVRAALIERLRDFRVVLNGTPVEPGRIAYAGVAPGFGGLYQVNLKLPELPEPNPEVRIAVGDEISPPGVRLPAVPH